ncbi:hypothetical protein AURDEDRAFT_189038 [Auricularia subglabra TFB-10046 SS5]|uniref:Uncharacterized protein n=1 Tax=Auricularia subglabra (strain TFB-10046 / SS5) TaxID=717982 RepID=J0WPU6_AURST|nr:hypothetical protein AURDEDRAFT_189038 [Auricularia subglabra TFB-10046 SS5]
MYRNNNNNSGRFPRRVDDRDTVRDIITFSTSAMNTVRDALGYNGGLQEFTQGRAVYQPRTRFNQQQRAPRSFNNGTRGNATATPDKFTQTVVNQWKRRERTRSKRAAATTQKASTAQATTANAVAQAATAPAPAPWATGAVQHQVVTDNTAQTSQGYGGQFYPQMVPFGAPFFPMPPFAPTLPASVAMPQQGPIPVPAQAPNMVFSFGAGWANEPPRDSVHTPFDLMTPEPAHPGVGHPAQQQMAAVQAGLGFPTTTFTHTSIDDAPMSIVGSPLPMEQHQALADSTLALTITDNSNVVAADNGGAAADVSTSTASEEEQTVQQEQQQPAQEAELAVQDVNMQQQHEDPTAAPNSSFVSSLAGALGDSN